MDLIVKTCNVCNELKKFLRGTPRDERNVCGNCWDWEKEPSFVELTDAQMNKLKEILKEKL
jgi:hypothetical protein